MTQFHRWFASALSGLLLVACFPKLALHPLVWIALLPLLLVLSCEPHPWRAFGWAYLTGAVYFTGSCYWFVEVTRQYGGLSTSLAVSALVAFAVVFSVFFGSFGLVVGTLARKSPACALLASPFLWIAMELARTYLITGFPWNLLGYGVQSAGLRQIASMTGVYGLSFLAAATSALVAWVILCWRSGLVRFNEPEGLFAVVLVERRRATRSSLVLVCWAALLLVGNWALAPTAPTQGPDLAVLVQPNVPLDEQAAGTWAPWVNPTKLGRLVELSLAAVASEAGKEGAAPDAQSRPRLGVPPLVIWAENPAPFYFTRDPVFRSAVERMARQAAAYVVVNTVIPLGTAGRQQITNSAVVLDPEGREILQYDKMHLVPFGEYVPAWAFPEMIGRITTEAGNFVPGAGYGVAPTPNGALGVFICYEDIFPQLVRRVTLAGAQVLVNISNDAWFGRSSAALQELEMARLRAIENHRYLLRATNDGITVMIDPHGRIAMEIPRYQTAAVAVRFSYLGAETFYTRHGDVFAWLCAALAAAMVLVASLSIRAQRGMSP